MIKIFSNTFECANGQKYKCVVAAENINQIRDILKEELTTDIPYSMSNWKKEDVRHEFTKPTFVGEYLC